MTDARPTQSPEARTLDVAVENAKEGMNPPALDWAAMESRLMKRVEDERPALVRDLASSSRRATVLRLSAVALAAAAAIAVVVRKDREGSLLDSSTPASAEASMASSLRSSEGTGEVRIGGVPAFAGHVVHAGDAIEVDGPRAFFDRPRKVAWLLEHDTHGVARARVKSAGDALVMLLEDGAIEAQVTPVASGEAFAVDVPTDRGVVRVAVHGTHLRVARAGNRVVVDLTEGVVSIGAPPRVGSTYGRLVTAPAHVELDASDPDATIRVDHTPSAVRPAISLAAEPAVVTQKDPPSTAPAKPLPAATQAKASAPTQAEPAATLAKAEPPKPPAPPREAIQTAVRDCASARSRPGVHVTFTGTVHLRLKANGEIETAHFDPPISPELQKCATPGIFKQKLEGETGTVSFPIEFSY